MNGMRMTDVASVWVWDSGWWSASVTYIVGWRGGAFFIVRLGNGMTMPVQMGSLRPRDPSLQGADKPRALFPA